jgi:hypothetical protein
VHGVPNRNEESSLGEIPYTPRAGLRMGTLIMFHSRFVAIFRRLVSPTDSSFGNSTRLCLSFRRNCSMLDVPNGDRDSSPGLREPWRLMPWETNPPFSSRPERVQEALDFSPGTNSQSVIAIVFSSPTEYAAPLTKSMSPLLFLITVNNRCIFLFTT